MPSPLELPSWPNGADVAVCLTFDVDAEAPWLAESADYASRLTTLSEGRYGIARALPRILQLLESRSIKGTFYVPGSTAERYPETIREIAEAGHEIGHHGHLHLRSHHISASEQKEEILRGLTALSDAAGVKPAGYRSPAWELTPETFTLLLEHGFEYDSSCMGDDRPYLEELDGGQLLELPVHWSLDDVPYFGWSVDRGGNLSSPSLWFECWRTEFGSALAEKRLVTYTMHPEVVGRGYRFQAFERLIDEMSASGKAWFASHDQVAALAAVGTNRHA